MVRPSRCCLMDFNNATTPSSHQATKRVHGPCVAARSFLTICANSQQVLLDEIQTGDYRDVRSSVVVSITWHLVTVRICYYVNIAVCSNIIFVLWVLPPKFSLNSELVSWGNQDHWCEIFGQQWNTAAYQNSSADSKLEGTH